MTLDQTLQDEIVRELDNDEEFYTEEMRDAFTEWLNHDDWGADDQVEDCLPEEFLGWFKDENQEYNMDALEFREEQRRSSQEDFAISQYQLHVEFGGSVRQL